MKVLKGCCVTLESLWCIFSRPAGGRTSLKEALQRQQSPRTSLQLEKQQPWHLRFHAFYLLLLFLLLGFFLFLCQFLRTEKYKAGGTKSEIRLDRDFSQIVKKKTHGDVTYSWGVRAGEWWGHMASPDASPAPAEDIGRFWSCRETRSQSAGATATDAFLEMRAAGFTTGKKSFFFFGNILKHAVVTPASQ